MPEGKDIVYCYKFHEMIGIKDAAPDLGRLGDQTGYALGYLCLGSLIEAGIDERQEPI